VRVEGVSKTFVLPQHHVETLKERALHPLRHGGHRRLEALRNVSVDVAHGEFFGIVGRNGSGKSTLLKCLAGIYRPSTGTIDIRGRLSPFIELGVGFNPDLTAYDNVVVNGTLLGLSPKEARRRFDAVIDFAELHDFLDLKLKNYSSGMQVRLAFAVAIQVDADILLIDEVLAVGDAAFQQKCLEEFQVIKRSGRTIILVTHDMGSVQRFCDRAMLLDYGEVKLTDSAVPVATAYHAICFESAPGAQRADGRSEARLGDGAAEILDGWFEDMDGEKVRVLHQGQRYRFVTDVVFHREMTNPGVGFHVHDLERKLVLVVDSQFQTPELSCLSEPLGVVAPGTRVAMKFEFDNVLGVGSYAVTSNVHPEGGPPVSDERQFFRDFQVTGHLATGGVVDLPTEVTVERKPPVGSALEPAS
jgi:ABC-type polysaccharide/polyol phosphate transport system ATPase subunit